MEIESTVGTVRRRLSDAERKEILQRVKAGDRYRDIARDVRCSRKTIQRLVNHSTPVLPAWVFTSESRLTFDERDKIANGLRNGELLRAIAARLGRAPSTISHEVRLGSDVRGRLTITAIELEEPRRSDRTHHTRSHAGARRQADAVCPANDGPHGKPRTPQLRSQTP